LEISAMVIIIIVLFVLFVLIRRILEWQQKS
jgi:hypothetical protein